MDNAYQEIKVIGELPLDEAMEKLAEIGETDLVKDIESQRAGGFLKNAITWKKTKPWEYTSHSFGYIPPDAEGEDSNIKFAGSIEPDDSLKEAQIKVSLDSIRIANYPGGSRHHILFDFYAQNQTKSANRENLHFSSTQIIQEGQKAAIIGFPIFIGLNAGEEGVNFRCLMINVKNEDDEKFLSFLNSDTFKSGLKIVNLVQPALTPFSELVYGLTKGIAERHRNIPVQDIHLGLDFSGVSTRAKLAEGSYIAVQIPESLEVIWDWDDWVYNSNSGHIVNRDDKTKLIPYNFIVLGVSKC